MTSRKQAAAGQVIDLGPESSVTIQAPCDQDLGNWVCLTHQTMFMNGIGLDSHTSSGGDHLLAWNCHHHGLEGAN